MEFHGEWESCGETGNRLCQASPRPPRLSIIEYAFGVEPIQVLTSIRSGRANRRRG